jgi:putative hydrolase of the HAD superfamily
VAAGERVKREGGTRDEKRGGRPQESGRRTKKQKKTDFHSREHLNEHGKGWPSRLNKRGMRRGPGAARRASPGSDGDRPTSPSSAQGRGHLEGRADEPVFIFDFGGVVIIWKNNYPIYDYIARRYGIPHLEMRPVFDMELPRLETGQVSIGESLEDALDRFGKKLRPGDSPEELWTRPFARLVKLRKGTVEVVESLRKRGFRVILFSNTSLPHVRFLKEVGWDRFFDGFLSSCELGSMKPDATAFARALEEAHAVPSQVVFIDDKETNVRGAMDFGIRWAFKFTSIAQLKRDIAIVLAAAVPRKRT